MAKTTFLALLLLLVTGSTIGVTPPNLDRALQNQLQQIEERPTDPQAYNDLGNLLVLARRADDAELAYKRALELAPFDAEIRFNYALLLQQEGRPEAKAELDQVLAVDPVHAWAHYQLGVLADDAGDRSKALELYAQAFALDSSLTFARNNPHIIDNRLATEALLRSNHYRDAPGGKVPRYYAEADRIRDVMMHDAAAAAAAEAPIDPEDTPDSADDATVGGGAAATGQARPVGNATPRRVGSGGEGGGSASRGESASKEQESEARPNSRRRGATYIPGAVRSEERPRPEGGTATTTEGRSGNRSSAEERGGNRTRSNPRAGARAPRARPGYRPPVRSTGRLELELLPAEPAVDPVVRG